MTLSGTIRAEKTSPEMLAFAQAFIKACRSHARALQADIGENPTDGAIEAIAYMGGIQILLSPAVLNPQVAVSAFEGLGAGLGAILGQLPPDMRTALADVMGRRLNQYLPAGETLAAALVASEEETPPDA